jgi:hypothetical protein
VLIPADPFRTARPRTRRDLGDTINDLDTRTAIAARARSRKKIILAIIAVVVLICGAVGPVLFQPWKLFTRNTVNVHP